MIYLLILLIGAVMGSFYLCIGTRLPLKKSILGRSECDNCHEKLNWYELIPIFSYLFLRGKCHHCHKKISFEYFIIELMTSLLFLVGYLHFGLNIQYYIYLVIVSCAIVIFITDFKYMVILDSTLIISSVLIIILKYFEIGFKNTLWAILFGICLFFTMYLIRLFGNFLFKRESLGGGDIKLAFLIGLTIGYPIIGYEMGLICLIFAAFLALPYAIAVLYLNKKNELPYGPFLIASLVIMFVFYDKFYNLLVFF